MSRRLQPRAKRRATPPPEPGRATQVPFWAIQLRGAAPLVLLVFLGLDGLRYAVLGPSPFERSIEIDVLYIADFNRLIAGAAAAILTVLLSLGNAHATT